MVATISPADDQYHHTVNTLKYADRAKEIKTHIHKNIGTVDTHVEDYQRMIENLQVEVSHLRKELAQKESQLSVKPSEKAADDELSWLNVLSHETSENVQERINLQKALFELEETNLRNRIELQHLDDAIAKQQVTEKDGTILQAMRSRRQVILDNIRDNDEVGASYTKDIETNEKRRCQLQDMIEEAISNNGNKTYLHILSQYRLLGMANTELQFEMAMRDQVIHNQREALRNLWNMLLGLGLKQKQIMDLAARQGITIEDWTAPNASIPIGLKQSPPLTRDKFSPLVPYPIFDGHPRTPMACVFQHHQDFSSTAYFNGHCDTHTVCRQEHRSSYYLLSHDHPHSVYQQNGKQWESAKHAPHFCTPEKLTPDKCSSYLPNGTKSCPCQDVRFSSASCSGDLGYQAKELWQNQQEISPVRSHSCNVCEESAGHGGTTQALFRSPSTKVVLSGIPNSHNCCYDLQLAYPDLSKLQSPCKTVVPRSSNLPGS